MRAEDVMSAPVVTVTPDASVKHVVELLVEHDISAVPVVDGSGVLVGIISESDLVPLQSVPDPRRHVLSAPRTATKIAHLASEVMTANVVSVTEDEDVTQVARLMVEHDIKHVPVVSGGRVTGIISRRDILKVLARSDADIQQDLQERLDDAIKVIGWYHAETLDGVVTLKGPPDPQRRRLAEILARGVPGVVGVRFSDQP